MLKYTVKIIIFYIILKIDIIVLYKNYLKILQNIIRKHIFICSYKITHFNQTI